jgi:hypothetical protein
LLANASAVYCNGGGALLLGGLFHKPRAGFLYAISKFPAPLLKAAIKFVAYVSGLVSGLNHGAELFA